MNTLTTLGILETPLGTLLIGIGATMVMDAWGYARKPLLGIAPPDYGLVGRWFAYMARGRFVHHTIKSSAPVRGERLLGWIIHYCTGIAFAASLVAIWGPGWLQQPDLLPALVVGLVSATAPFLLMQPGMGSGIAASRTPNPTSARLQSVTTHMVFGLGLYAAALVVHRLPLLNQ